MFIAWAKQRRRAHLSVIELFYLQYYRIHHKEISDFQCMKIRRTKKRRFYHE